MKVAVIGAGAWGTALSVLLATKGVPVYLWARRREFAEELRAYRENRTYLPGVALPALVWPTSEAEEALEGADLALVALPSRAVREILSAFPKAPLYVSATKGLYLSSGVEGSSRVLKRMSQVIQEATGVDRVLALSGPNHAEEVARFLVGRFGGSYGLHVAFGTAQVRLPFGLAVDLAEAREEYYPYPGALPKVRPSSIAKDLERRDYTVNAMALALEDFRLLDPYGGLSDLKARLLRPLHPLSFVEDPTRIARGARLAARLGFRLAEEAFPQVKPALLPEVLDKVSGSRLRDELYLILKEPEPTRALEVLEDWGALRPLFGLTPPPQRASGAGPGAGREACRKATF
ncbi:MAG: hypothetical protein C4298_01025 [Thermus sp.]